jgi:hypothetical protein
MEACQVLLSNKEAIYACVGVSYAVLEFWLGRTSKVQAASAIELILSPILKKRSTEDQK